MNRAYYFKRLGIEAAELPANLEKLIFLQRQHLLNIPFENLDIHWRRLIVLDEKSFFEKIISQKRGGFCYELNGLFFQLLKEISFQSRLISARVNAGEKDKFGAEYDHLAILTKIGDEEFLVDVGFGAFAAAPLKFVLDVEQADENGTFSIRKFDDRYFEVVKKDGDQWQSEYIFKNLSRDLQEFAGMCEFHQTSPESHFTRKKICSLMTENGRKTLSDDKFIETVNGEKKETSIESEDEFYQILSREFQIERNL